MRHSRTQLLVGSAGMQKLANAHVAVFGVGGVGSYALEALARAGVGHLYIVDFDCVEESNINRQIIALDSTIGLPKTRVAAERIAQINPSAEVIAVQEFIAPDTVASHVPPDTGFAIDAIDIIASKIPLIEHLYNSGIVFISCMGAARKLDPTGFKIADIGSTRYCPLARIVRHELRNRGITKGVRCIYSEENDIAPGDEPEITDAPACNGNRKRPQGTISYMPAIMGLMAAGAIINDILKR